MMISISKRVWRAVCFAMGIAPGALGQVASGQPAPRVIEYDATHLKAYSTEELIDLLSEGSLQKNAQAKGIYSVAPPDRRRLDSAPGRYGKEFFQLQLDSHALDYADAVEKELVVRRPFQELLTAFETTPDRVQQAWILDVLAQVRGPEVDKSLRRFVSSAKDETTYLALKYFSLACDNEALNILNKNYFHYGTSSAEWASIVRSFGECKYKPATAHLVDTVSAMIIELGYASHRSLLAIYPDATIEFRDPFETEKAWQAYLKQHR